MPPLNQQMMQQRSNDQTAVMQNAVPLVSPMPPLPPVPRQQAAPAPQAAMMVPPMQQTAQATAPAPQISAPPQARQAAQEPHSPSMLDQISGFFRSEPPVTAPAPMYAPDNMPPQQNYGAPAYEMTAHAGPKGYAAETQPMYAYGSFDDASRQQVMPSQAYESASSMPSREEIAADIAAMEQELYAAQQQREDLRHAPVYSSADASFPSPPAAPERMNQAAPEMPSEQHVYGMASYAAPQSLENHYTAQGSPSLLPIPPRPSGQADYPAMQAQQSALQPGSGQGYMPEPVSQPQNEQAFFADAPAISPPANHSSGLPAGLFPQPAAVASHNPPVIDDRTVADHYSQSPPPQPQPMMQAQEQYVPPAPNVAANPVSRLPAGLIPPEMANEYGGQYLPPSRYSR